MNPCPFYAESGGQVGDRGTLEFTTVHLSSNGIACFLFFISDCFSVGRRDEGHPRYGYSARLRGMQCLEDCLDSLRQGIPLIRGDRSPSDWQGRPRV